MISFLKRFYGTTLLQRMRVCIDSEKQYEVDLVSAIHMLAHSSKPAKKTTVANCFRQAGFLVNSAAVTADSETTADDESEDSSLAAALLANGFSVDLNTYQGIDDNLPTCWEDTLLSLNEEVQDMNGKKGTKVRCHQMLKRNL